MASLKEQLWAFMAANNPDMLLRLQEQRDLSRYLEQRVAAVTPMAAALSAQGNPDYITERLCLDALTDDLQPSRYGYVYEILEEDFPETFAALREAGVLTFEISNMIGQCDALFEHFGFGSGGEDHRHLRYAVLEEIDRYLRNE